MYSTCTLYITCAYTLLAYHTMCLPQKVVKECHHYHDYPIILQFDLIDSVVKRSSD